jgi:hypothetical protein
MEWWQLIDPENTGNEVTVVINLYIIVLELLSARGTTKWRQQWDMN